MKAGQLGRTLAEAESRYRGDHAPVSTTDPRRSQAGFDAERTTMDARIHDAACRCQDCQPAPVGHATLDVRRLEVALLLAVVVVTIMLCAAGAR